MNNKSSAFYEDKSSGGMATASLVFGILAIITCCCIYTAMIFGALAVIFALLSRGGERKLSSVAVAGLILGIIGMVLGILFISFFIISAILEYGGLEHYIDSYYDFLPDDYYFYENQYENFF